jgi:hypothetical protein
MDSHRTTTWLLITGILLLAALLRLGRLHTMPWGLSQDEVVNADISLSVLAGEGAPFLAGGFGHEPLFHYLQAIALTLFGDNVIGIRMPAIAAGMMLVAASYALMRQLFGPVAALVTATGLSISWWPVIFSRIGIRAITFPLLLTLATVLFWRGLRRDRRALVLSAGLVYGLAFYTYTSSRILPALALAWLAYAAGLQRKRLRRHGKALVGAGLIAAVVVAPLVVYLYTHPELQERVQQLEGPLLALHQGNLRPLLRGTWVTLAMFSRSGEARWTYGIPGRPILGPISGLLFYLGLARCLVQARRPACGLIGLWLLVTLVPSMVTPDAPSSIRAIGALPAAYGMVGLGAAWLWEWLAPTSMKGSEAPPTSMKGSEAASRSHRLRSGLIVGMSLVGLIHLVWTYRDGFGTWASHHEVYWLYKSHFADIAAYLDDQSTLRPLVVFEEWVDPVDVNGVRRDLIHDERQPRWAQAGGSFQHRGKQSRSAAFIWPAGADRFTLAMPIYTLADPDIWRLFAGDPTVAAASAYRMPDDRPGVTFYAIDTQPKLTGFLAQATTAPVTLPESTQPISLPADFGGQIALLGYQVLDSATPGGELQIVTAWRIQRDGPEPLNVFLHLLDESGNLVTQCDGFDAWAASLHSGDVVAQLCAIPLEDHLSPGQYLLQVGAYTRADQIRLPVLVAGSRAADRLWLGTVEVRP